MRSAASRRYAPLRSLSPVFDERVGETNAPRVARAWSRRLAPRPTGQAATPPKAWRITLLLGRAARVTAVSSIPQVAQRK